MTEHESQPSPESLTKFKRSSSIKTRLIFWFLLLSILPIMTISLFNYQLSKNDLIASAKDHLIQASDQNARFIRTWFNYRFMDINILAHDQQSQALLSSLTQGFRKSNQKLSEYVKSYDWTHRADLLQEKFINFQYYYDYIYDVLLIDAQGNILFSVAREADFGTNLQKGPYAKTLFADSFRNTQKSGKINFSDLERYRVSGSIVAGFITAPILNDEGEKIGVLAIQIRTDRILKSLNLEYAKTSLINYLVGEDRLLRSPLSFTEKDDLSDVLTKEINTEQTNQWLSTNHSSEVKLQQSVERVALEYVSARNNKVIGIHQDIQVPGVRWAIISEINTDEAFLAINKMTQITFLLLTITIISVFIIAIYQIRKITQPIKKLSQSALNIAKGCIKQETEQSIIIESNDEIGQLSRSFHHMLIMRKKNEQELLHSSQQAEQALAELSEQKSALDQHSIVAITDLSGTITYANQLFADISGYSNEELIGQNHRMLNSGCHSNDFWKNMFHTVLKKHVWQSDVCNKAKDGSLYWVDTTIVLIKDANNKPQNFIAIRSDITQRKLQDRAIKEAKSQLEFVINSTSVGIWDWQVQTGEVIFNDRWAEIIGYTLEELGSVDINTWLEHAHPDELAESTEKLEQHWQGESNHYRLEARMKHKDGHWVWVLDTGKVVEWKDDGKPKRMIGTHIDISQQKTNEAALIQAREEAEGALIAKGEFLASMSHEIRTPMNGVLGMLGLLLNTELNDEQRHRTSVAQSSAKALLTLINDILDFSKVEAGKLDLEMLDFNLRTMLGDLAESMALQAHNKGLEIILDVKHIEHSMVKGDPGRIRQILTNLLSNAIKFTDKGEIIMTVSVCEHASQRLKLHCTIQDTGIGIPEDKISSLFSAFSQVDSSTTRKYGGTGLGLSIVKKLCELMNGEVTVSSHERQGSCFEFNLLLEHSDSSQQVMPQFDVSQLKLLIVDDNATNREVLRGQLEHWGIDVQEASSGADALQLCYDKINANESLFDIALLDMQMPEMDGVELSKKFCAESQLSTMKLVMMTSMNYQEDAHFFADLGFSAYFPKPASTSDIFDALSVVAENGEALKNASSLVTHHYLETLRYNSSQSKNTLIKEAQASPKEKKECGSNIWPDNTRLLLVEDNQINQMVANGVLNDIGLQADIAANGLEALSSLINSPNDAPYSLILMDCQMPEMDGYEASESIRSGKAGIRYKNIAIVAMTANAMQGDKEKCLASGMNDYLTKPIDPDRIHDMLCQWLPNVEKSVPAVTERQIPEIQSVVSADNSTISSFIDLPNSSFEISDSDKQSIWDKEAALKLVKGKAKRLLPLISLFLEDMPARIEELQQAIAKGDNDLIRLTAHTIKGVSANLSGIKLQVLTGQLEADTKSNKAQTYTEQLPEIITAYKQLSQLMKNYQEEQERSQSAPTLTVVSEVTSQLKTTSNTEKKGNILIVDDTKDCLLSLRAILEDDYNIIEADSGEACLKLIKEHVPDLVLLDVIMPGMSGYEVCDHLQKNADTKEVPIIFVTSNDNEWDEQQGLERGAVDYMTKPIHASIALARVKTHINLKKQHDQLLTIATHDQLTGLHNRHYLMLNAKKKIAHATRHLSPLSFIMMDIDHFKDVNDQHGHPMGDKVLVMVAERLNELSREEDIIARIGGEEFIIVLDRCTLNQAEAKAAAIRTIIENSKIDGLGVTSSFGVVQMTVEGESIDDLIMRADTALYKAKESGRNCVVVG